MSGPRHEWVDLSDVTYSEQLRVKTAQCVCSVLRHVSVAPTMHFATYVDLTAGDGGSEWFEREPELQDPGCRMPDGPAKSELAAAARLLLASEQALPPGMSSHVASRLLGVSIGQVSRLPLPATPPADGDHRAVRVGNATVYVSRAAEEMFARLEKAVQEESRK